MSNPSSPKRFGKRTAYIGDDKKRAVQYVIYCHECGGDDTIQIVKHGLPDEVIERKFRDKGWIIGTTRASDLCPDCIERKHADKRQRAAEREEAKALAAKDINGNGHAYKGIPDISREDLIDARQTVALLFDRQAKLFAESDYIDAALLNLVDRSAEVRDDLSKLTAEIHAIRGFDDIDIDRRLANLRESDLFTRIDTTSRHSFAAERKMRAGYTPSTKQTVLVLAGQLMKELGFTAEDRAFIHQGEGEDAGLYMIERTRETIGSLKPAFSATGTARITTAYLKPVDPDAAIPTTEVKFTIREGNLVFRLPPEFSERNVVKDTMAAARAELASL